MVCTDEISDFVSDFQSVFAMSSKGLLAVLAINACNTAAMASQKTFGSIPHTHIPSSQVRFRGPAHKVVENVCSPPSYSTSALVQCVTCVSDTRYCTSDRL